MVISINDNQNSNTSKFTDINVLLHSPPAALAQIVNSNKTQIWVDKENNVKIIFTYNPVNPIADKPVKLLFGVYNLFRGNNIKGASHMRIIITNGPKILKIINAESAKGNFSINYTFPDPGSYQVISKIDSNNVKELASFNLFVPPQGFSSSSKSFVDLMVYYVIPTTTSAAGIAIYLSNKKKT
jgi:hypothetical protein